MCHARVPFKVQLVNAPIVYLFFALNLQGMDCCSDYAASFHFVSPTAMYVLEYLIYHLQPYGISYHAKMPAEVSEGIGTHDEKSREHSSDFT